MLSMEPLLVASPAIQFHVVMATAAAVAGLLILLIPKGTAQHKWLGRLFALAMGAAALSSFFIHEIRSFGSFSLIHLLSIFVLFSLVRAIRTIRRGQVREHRLAMIGTYIGGIVIAGGFTFLPGRMMARMTYGGMDGEFLVFWLFLALASVWLLTGVFRTFRSGSVARDQSKSHQ